MDLEHPGTILLVLGGLVLFFWLRDRKCGCADKPAATPPQNCSSEVAFQ